ncbi:monocarboxylate transporter 12-like [Ptychodera flava]|uniref:monocarboxylate transporter 12-like n=1 Tax=Ptychodera flava TaxID=63121 RepID=UPI003969F371
MSATGTKSPELRDPPDGGWGWFVISATFIMMFVVKGIGTSLAVFYVVFLDYFGGSAAGTSLVLSLFKAVNMTGVSFGLCYVACFASLGRYFKKRYTIANGIALAGVGLSTFILPPLSQLLIDKYGWRGTLVIVSALTAHLCVGAALLRPIRLKADSSEENGAHTDSLSDKTVMRDENSDSEDNDPGFDNCSCDTRSGEVRSIKEGDLQRESNTLVLDVKPCIKSTLTVEQCRSHGGNSIENLTSPRNSAKDETVNGDNVAEMRTVAGVDQMVEGIGVIMFCSGSSFFVGPSLSGYLFDMTGSYDLSFYVAGILLVISSCIFPSSWIYRMVKAKLCHSTDIRVDDNIDNRTPHTSV